MVDLIGGIPEYILSVIGINFGELTDISPAQTIIIIFGCLVAVFVLLFIIRGVLGGTMHLFR